MLILQLAFIKTKANYNEKDYEYRKLVNCPDNYLYCCFKPCVDCIHFNHLVDEAHEEEAIEEVHSKGAVRVMEVILSVKLIQTVPTELIIAFAASHEFASARSYYVHIA